MILGYGITAFVSLCMVGACVLTDKKRDIWLILLFVSVSICNLGYFMLPISKDLGDALNSNRIAYLGSVFLPFFLFMMVLRFCGIKRNRTLTVVLALLGVGMLAITTSPGILPIYYDSVSIAITENGTKLLRTYGPLHKLYYVYLIGYMLSMIGIALHSVAKKRIKSRLHTTLLLCAVFCNMVIWLVEQFLPRGFEWLSVSYILTEALILVIYHSMQKRGLSDQNEQTHSYTVSVLLSAFLLLFANFLRVVTKDTTPVVYLLSQVVVLMIYLGILIFWAISVHERILNPGVRRYLITLVALMVFWMLMRTLRFTVFYHVFPYGQWCWYAYYVGMILIPQICLFASNYIGKSETHRMSKAWYLMYIPSLLMIFGILTNDLHQWAFRFHRGYELGWDIYQRGVLYYAAVAWIFGCIALMIRKVFKNCRIPKAKKTIWLPLVTLTIGVSYSILYAVDTNLFGFIEITAALCFTAVAIWESCIKAGLIPSNTHYDELLKCSDLGVTVADRAYKVHYSSGDALALPKEQMQAAAESPVILDGGIRLSGSKIRGGYVLWQEDISELLDGLDELSALREELKDSNTVSMQNYQMNKRIRSFIEKNRLYDELHKQTARQLDLMSKWLKRLTETEDANEKRSLLSRIIVIGSYLKRRNNLILVNEQDGCIQEGELSLSVKEMMKNLQLAGVSCAASVELEGAIPSDAVLELFDFYESVVERAFDGLSHLLARFFYRDGAYYCCVDAVCAMDLTALATDEVSVSISEENYYILSFKTKGGGSK